MVPRAMATAVCLFAGAAFGAAADGSTKVSKAEMLARVPEIVLEGAKTPLSIHIPDNPPLFAWVERMYYRQTGDKVRHFNRDEAYWRGGG